MSTHDTTPIPDDAATEALDALFTTPLAAGGDSAESVLAARSDAATAAYPVGTGQEAGPGYTAGTGNTTGPARTATADFTSDYAPARTPGAYGAGTGPRIRWAAIVWGLLFAATAVGTLVTVLSPLRRFEFADWAVGLEPQTIALYGTLAVGALVLLASLVGLLRRAQRTLAERRSAP